MIGGHHGADQKRARALVSAKWRALAQQLWVFRLYAFRGTWRHAATRKGISYGHPLTQKAGETRRFLSDRRDRVEPFRRFASSFPPLRFPRRRLPIVASRRIASCHFDARAARDASHLARPRPRPRLDLPSETFGHGSALRSRVRSPFVGTSRVPFDVTARPEPPQPRCPPPPTRPPPTTPTCTPRSAFPPWRRPRRSAGRTARSSPRYEAPHS